MLLVGGTAPARQAANAAAVYTMSCSLFAPGPRQPGDGGARDLAAQGKQDLHHLLMMGWCCVSIQTQKMTQRRGAASRPCMQVGLHVIGRRGCGSAASRYG